MNPKKEEEEYTRGDLDLVNFNSLDKLSSLNA